MRALARLHLALIKAMAALAALGLVAIAALIIVDVILRSGGATPPAFTLSVVEYLLLYFALLAAPWLVRIKKHIYINALLGRLTGRARMVVSKMNYLLCTVASAAVTIASFNLLIQAIDSGQLDIRTIDMPMWVLFMPIPLSFGLMTIEFGRYLLGIDEYYAALTDVQEGM